MGVEANNFLLPIKKIKFEAILSVENTLVKITGDYPSVNLN